MKLSFLAALVATASLFFGAVAHGGNFYSWEGSLEGWTADPASTGATAESQSAADGVPAAAITDGDYALAVGRPDGAGWTAVVRAENPLLLADLKANTTLSMDVFIPTASYGGFWATIGAQIEGQNMTGGLKVEETLLARNGVMSDPVGETFSVEWDYASEFTFNPDANWMQLTLVIQGGGTMSPVYFDNFRLSGAETPGDFDQDGDVDGADFLLWQRDPTNLDLAAWESGFGTTGGSLAGFGAVPEPSSFVMLSIVSALGGLGWQGRRRSR